MTRVWTCLLLPVVLLISSVSAAEPFEDVVGQPVQTVLRDLRASGLKLIYNDQLVRADLIVLEAPQSEEPVDVAEEILLPHGLTLHEVIPGTYVVTTIPGAQESGSVAGNVREGATGRLVSGATVTIVGTDLSTETATDGHYVLTVPPGRYEIRTEVEGFEDTGRQINVEADEVTVALLELTPTPSELGHVVVTASQYELFGELQSNSTHFLSREQLEHSPDLGEDAVRAINRLPGAATTGLSAQPFIRGGDQDELLITYDGMRLYEPFHLKDFQSIFSIIDPSVVDYMEMHTGGFSARHGDKMSAVLDIKPRQPDTREWAVGLSFFNALAQGGGTFADGRGDWLAALRKGTLDLLFQTIAPEAANPSYFDALGRVSYQLNDSTAVSGSYMLSQDEVGAANSDSTEKSIGNYRNAYLWLKLDKDWNGRLSTSTLFGYTNVDNFRIGQVDKSGLYTGWVDDARRFDIATLKQDWSYSRNDRHLIFWGFELSSLSAEYDYRSEVSYSDIVEQAFGIPSETRRYTPSPSGEQFGLYTSHRLQLTDRLTTDLGLRWDRQTYTLPGGENQLSPRVGFLYQLAPRTQLRASWGRFYQSQEIGELQVEDGVDHFFPAQQAKHTIVGVEHLFDNNYRLRVEAYRKEMVNLRPRFENLFDPIVLVPELEPDRVEIAPDSALAHGVEFLVSGDPARLFNWWASYTWSTAKDITDGVAVARSWDQTHAFGFGIDWSLANWNVSAAGTYHTGWPTTTLSFNANPPDFDVGQRNAMRYSNFATLDVRAGRVFRLQSGNLEFFVEVTNALNNANPCCVQYSLEPGPDGEPVLNAEKRTWLPILPSLGFLWRF